MRRRCDARVAPLSTLGLLVVERGCAGIRSHVLCSIIATPSTLTTRSARKVGMLEEGAFVRGGDDAAPQEALWRGMGVFLPLSF